MRRLRPALLPGVSLALLLVSAAPRAEEGPVGAASYALTPPSTGGLEAVDRMLRRLGTHRRLLVIGAHPDDEDTELLSLVAKGMGGEAAYLSLSRGEGGQNLVGPDLGAAEWADLLRPISGRLVFVDTSSASFPFLQKLSGRDRIVASSRIAKKSMLCI